jgi:hypothetical protein
MHHCPSRTTAPRTPPLEASSGVDVKPDAHVRPPSSHGGAAAVDAPAFDVWVQVRERLRTRCLTHHASFARCPALVFFAPLLSR